MAVRLDWKGEQNESRPIVSRRMISRNGQPARNSKSLLYNKAPKVNSYTSHAGVRLFSGRSKSNNILEPASR